MLRKLVIAPVQNAPVNDAEVIVIGAQRRRPRRHRAACWRPAAGWYCSRPGTGSAAGPDPRFVTAWPSITARRSSIPSRRNPWTTIARRLGVATMLDPKRRLRSSAPGRRASRGKLRGWVHGARAGGQRGGRGGGGLARGRIAEALRGLGPWSAQAQVALGPWGSGLRTRSPMPPISPRGVSGRDRLVDIGYGRLVAAYGRGRSVRLNAAVRRMHFTAGKASSSRTAGSQVRGRLAIVAPCRPGAGGRARALRARAPTGERARNRSPADGPPDQDQLLLR